MEMVRQIRSPIICLLLASIGLIAQVDDDQPSVSLSFAVLPLDSAVAEEKLFYTEEGTTTLTNAIELSLNHRERSNYYEYQGVNPMPIFRKQKDDDGVIQLVIAYLVAYDDSHGTWLVLLDKAKDGQQAPFDSHAFRYDESNFPEGSLLFFNATGAVFHGILGGRQIKISPGDNPPIDVSDFYKKDVRVGLIVKDGDQVHKVFATKLSFYPERRTLMILRAPKKASSFRIQAQRINEYLGNFDPNDPGA